MWGKVGGLFAGLFAGRSGAASRRADAPGESGRAKAAGRVSALLEAQPDVDMVWFDETRLPIPDWASIDAGGAPADDAETRDAFRTAAAGHWLQALGDALPEAERPYRVHASADFLLLSALGDREVELLLQFCQAARRRILRQLGDAATARSGGRHVLLLFADEDSYYDYVSHFYPDDGGEYARSSGMFIHDGYGHFALFEGDMQAMQPTIVHELTHCLLAHLPIPAWLNEGMAVNTEHGFFPWLAHPGHLLYHPEELPRKHLAFWNPQTVQEFWSGKSFLRTDDGNELSYDLAKRLVARLAQADAPFRAFLRGADRRDGGIGAEAVLGLRLESLLVPMLGEGDWRPRPELWRDGTEGGHFRPFRSV